MSTRCGWSESNPQMIAYHDTEWGVPVHDDRQLFGKLVLDGFQAGLSWAIILRKRDAFLNAFDGFHLFGIETVEGVQERVALAQDDGPRQSRLKSIEHELAEELPVVVDRYAPLGVMIGNHLGI